MTKILIPARNLLKDRGEMVCLIKPQFEAGRDKVGKKGVVRERSVHAEVIHKVIDFAYSIGFDVMHLEYSPIKGPEGNIEYLVHIRKNGERSMAAAEWTESDGEQNLERLLEERTGESWTAQWNTQIENTVGRAHDSLDKPETGSE